MSVSAASELRAILRAHPRRAHDRWRAWSEDLMRPGRLSPKLLVALWQEVLDFDPVLATHINRPVPVPEDAVIVAGSGKETFKTFNVSTAAGILAASVGAKVVKGVSHSVSAVTGAADVLNALGITSLTHPSGITTTVETDGIGFVPYAAFCPTYAGRYDGVFPVLSPLSFSMPVAVLAVTASRFVYGLAHREVHLAAATLRMVRPELETGFVAASEITADEMMDEWAKVGTVHTAILREGGLGLSRQAYGLPGVTWRDAVAHRNCHTANARALTDALSPTGHPARAELAEYNAALIVLAHDRQMTLSDALAMVRDGRRSGQAQDLLERLRDRKRRADTCTAS